MSVTRDSAEEHAGVPPIVLFVDDDQDTLDLYGSYFDEAGLWVVATADPVEAFLTAAELKPNLIVADIGFADRPAGIELVCALKADEQLRSTPIIVVSGRPRDELKASADCGAEVVLSKPVPPQALLERARALLERACDLREQSQRWLERSHAEQARSTAILGQSAAFSKQRRCPTCGSLLEWIESGTIEGVEYDYFHRCARGCGLFCFERLTGRSIKLA